MEFYPRGIDNVEQWVVSQLPRHYKKWTEEESPLRQELDALEPFQLTYSKANFDALSAKFNQIVIGSGQPRGDYGQTIRLDRVAGLKVSTPNYEWGKLPHEQRPLQYLSNSMFHTHQLAAEFVNDSFVFTRAVCPNPDGQPRGWNELQEAVLVCRSLSEITLFIDEFNIRWTTDNIWIDIVIYPNSFKKPPFAMNS